MSRTSDPLSIAFVGHKTLPANYGGVEVYAEEVGARLASRGHTVLSFTSAADQGEQTHRGVQRHTVGRLDGKHMGALSQAFTASMAACRADVDIIHFMAMGPSIFAPMVRLRSSAAVVVTVAGRDDQRRKWGPIARRLMRLSYHSCRRFSDTVIGVSQALTDELKPVTKGRCVYIANGVTIPPEPVISVEDIGIASKRYVLYAARLVPEKRVEVLIDAFAAVDADVDLLIAGGPAGAKGYVEMLEERGAADPRVRFLGHRHADEVDALMRNAEIFVLPSELEGMPIALLEATGRGVPVVVSDLPCHLEVLGTGGPGARIVPVGDVSALTAAISVCLADANGRVDAANRAEHIVATYTWDKVTDQVEAAYLNARADRRADQSRRTEARRSSEVP